MTVLLAARVERIQSYLLTSPRLRQIRGGSQLLVNLDRRFQDAVSSEGGMVACAAGGLFMAAFQGPGEAGRGERAAVAVRRAISQTVPAATSWVATTAWDRSRRSFGDATAAVVAAAGQGRGAAVGAVADLGFVRPCDVCRVRGARRERQYEWGTQRVCPDCDARASVSVARSALEVRLRDLGAWPAAERPGRPATVDDLARGRPAGYIAYVAADGNSVGDRLDQVDSPEALWTFSEGLREATAGALIDAVAACLPASSTRKDDYRGLPDGSVLPVIVGGDDVVVFSAPALGLPLAVEFARAFETRAQAAVGDRLTTGVGVVVAHASTPFAALDEAAHRLQGRAKQLHRRHAATGRLSSTVAFGLVSSGPPGAGAPERLAARDALPERSLGVDAYTVGDAALLVTTALGLKAVGAPPSRLKQLAAVLRDSHHGVDADWKLTMASRSMGRARSLVEKAAELPSGSARYGVEPWRTVDGALMTAVPDLLALAAIL